MIKTNQYLEKFARKRSGWVETLEQYAKEYRVPIIDKVSGQFLLQLVRMNRPKAILEIGTAIGYSTLLMHEIVPDASIVTIEKNEQTAEIAQENIVNYALKIDNISLIKGDALEVIERFPIDTKFDFVFIDAAKGQYERFFSLIDPLVERNGVIITDNVLFRSFVLEKEENVPKRYRTLVKKLKVFNENMMHNEEYHSTMIPLGDGLIISVKK